MKKIISFILILTILSIPLLASCKNKETTKTNSTNQQPVSTNTDVIPTEDIKTNEETNIEPTKTGEVSSDPSETTEPTQTTTNEEPLEICLHEITEINYNRNASCTSDGYTGDTYCSECGELIEQGHIIPRIDHIFVNGVCEICNEVDPNYISDSFYCKYLTFDQEVDFTNCPKAYIDIYKWSQKYTPKAYAQLIFKENDGFWVKMYCEEKNPRATFTSFSDDVYLDSCLEFFFVIDPENFDGHYVNIEMNANGAFFASWSTGIGNYSQEDLLKKEINVTPFKDENGWGVTLHIKNSTMKQLYPALALSENSKFTCNFYKTGSGCEIPHYGVWSLVDLENPNFHKPEFFSEVIIKK